VGITDRRIAERKSIAALRREAAPSRLADRFP
jgi:hypothetical protein